MLKNDSKLIKCGYTTYTMVHMKLIYLWNRALLVAANEFSPQHLTDVVFGDLIGVVTDVSSRGW